MLTLMTGRSGPTSAEKLFSLVNEGASHGIRQLIITPSDRSHRAERLLLQSCGSRIAMTAEVSTFDRIASAMAEMCGVSGPVLTEGGRILTMFKAVKNSHTGLKFFRRLPSSVSALTSLLEFSDSLKLSGTDPEDILRVSDELSPRLSDLALISAEYRRLCLSGAADPRDILDIAAETEGSEEYFFGCSCFLWGFDGFTAQELEIIRLMLKSCDVTVMMEAASDRHLCARQIRGISALERLCSSLGVKIEKDTRDYDSERPFEKPALAALGVVSSAAAEGIELFTAATEAEECELAAALCRKLSLTGTRLRKIAVISGASEKYAPILESAFAKYGVPIYSGSKKPLLGFPPVTALLGAMEAVTSGYETGKVLAWLKSGLSGLLPEEAEDVENYVFTWNINGRRWLSRWKQPTEGYRAAEADQAALDRIEALREKATAPLQLLEKLCRDASCGRETARAIEKYMDSTGYEAALEAISHGLFLSGRERESALYAQIYRNINECLEQAALLLGDEKVNLRDFTSLFRLMLSRYGLITIPQSVDCVGFGGPDSPSDGVKYVIVLGCTEGVLPVPPKRNAILPESDLIALEEFGISVTNMLEEAFAAQYDLYCGLSAPSEGLILMRPLTDGKGASCHRAAFFGRFESFCGAPKAAEKMLRSLRFTAKDPAFEAFCREDAPEYGEMYPEEAERLKELDRRLASPWQGISDPGKLASLFGQEPQLSDSRLTDLANCPLSFFLKHGLKASAAEKAVFGPAEIGTFIHEVVENSVKELCSTGGDAEAVVEKYSSVFAEKHLPGFEDKGRRFAWLYEKLKENASVIISDVMDEINASSFKPKFFEVGFGDGLELPAVRISTPTGAVRLRGRIDRVDMAEEGDTLYFKVSDYKTGNKVFDITDMTMGLNLQLFIYLEAVSAGSEKLFGKKALPAAALYIPARAAFGSSGDQEEDKNKRKGIFRDDLPVSRDLEGLSAEFYPGQRSQKGFYRVSGERLSQLLDTVRDSIRSSAESMPGAEPSPIVTGPGRSSCDYCDFKDVCGVMPELIRRRRFEKISANQFFERLDGDKK